MLKCDVDKDKRIFYVKNPIIWEVIALRISLYGTTVKSELRRMAKRYSAVANLKAIDDGELLSLSNKVSGKVSEYSRLSRNKRKEKLRELMEAMTNDNTRRTSGN